MLVKNVILFVGLFCLYSNYLVFNSYVYQKILLNEASQDTFFLSNKLDDLNYSYPSLALNSVPILTYISRYDTNNSDYNSAIIKLNESLKKNPNSIYTKYLLARNYIYLNNMINAESVLEDLFYESPNLRSSSSLYFAVLATNKNFPKLKSHFQHIKTIDDQITWSFYIESLKSLYFDKSFDDFYYLVLEEYNLKFTIN